MIKGANAPTDRAAIEQTNAVIKRLFIIKLLYYYKPKKTYPRTMRPMTRAIP